MRFHDLLGHMREDAVGFLRDVLQDLSATSGPSLSDRKHRKLEEFIWKATLILSAITTAGAFLGATFAYKTYLETKRQADAAEAANRPWITIARAEVAELSGVGDKISVVLKVSLKNVGHDPAFRVNYKGNLFSIPDQDAREANCHGGGDSDLGLSLFGNDISPALNLIFTRDKSLLENSISRQISQDEASLPNTMPDEMRQRSIQGFIKGRNSPAYEAGGCINYLDTKGIEHNTVFQMYIFASQKRLDVRSDDSLKLDPPIPLAANEIRIDQAN